MISHNEAQTLISIRQEQRIDPYVEAELAQHLDTCAHCRAFAESTDRLTSGLRSLPYGPTSSRVRQNVLMEIEKGRSPWARLFGSLGMSPGPAVATLAMVAVIGVLGWFVFDRIQDDPNQHSGGNDQVAQQAAPTKRAFDLEPTATATNAPQPTATQAAQPTSTSAPPTGTQRESALPSSQPTSTSAPPADAPSRAQPTATSAPPTNSQRESALPSSQPTSTTAPPADAPMPAQPTATTESAPSSDSAMSRERRPTATSAPAETVIPAETPTPTSVPPTSEPTATQPLPTATQPAVTETPVDLTTADSEKASEPTATNAPLLEVAREQPTETPAPTQTPVPTDVPTETPSPTQTPVPTDVPTETPVPTQTPVPTEVPTETPAPTATEDSGAKIEPIDPSGLQDDETPTATTTVQTPTAAPTATSPAQQAPENVIEPIDQSPTAEATATVPAPNAASDNQKIEPLNPSAPGSEATTPEAPTSTGDNTIKRSSQSGRGGERAESTPRATSGATVPLADAAVPFQNIDGSGDRLAVVEGRLIYTNTPNMVTTTSPSGATIEVRGSSVTLCSNGECAGEASPSAAGQGESRPIGFAGETGYAYTVGPDGVTFLALTGDGMTTEIGTGGQDLTPTGTAWTDGDTVLQPTQGGHWLHLSNDGVSDLGPGPAHAELVKISGSTLSYVENGQIHIASVDAPGSTVATIPFNGTDYDTKSDGTQVVISTGSAIEIYTTDGTLVKRYDGGDIRPGAVIWLKSGIVFVDTNSGSLYQIENP